MATHTHATKKGLLIASLGALGVVYGDIGTSPLYAVNEIFFGAAHEKITPGNVMGIISLVFWALTIVISIKYVVFVLRADNEGEGGVFALYGLLANLKKKKYIIWVSLLLVFGAGLLFGDGVITPAISVISAVEGLKLVTHSFDHLVVPITIVILTGLFFVQKNGTAKVGAVFGPIIAVWFTCIGLLGTSYVVKNPEILQSVNPIYAVSFIQTHHLSTVFLVLGAIILTVTGGEAMYADMGHFGAAPIRLSWFSLAYPALILNYMGQGAMLLSGQKILSENIFFSMVPSWGLIPMVILATMATIIASQALITGAFSLATQASALNLFPRLNVIHTYMANEGQKYVPFINWTLYGGTVLLVLTFQSSSRLAGAYGLAESGVMLITTLGMIIAAKKLWNWHIAKALLIFIPLGLVDFLFFSANSLKILEGGFIPLMIALAVWIIMQTWQWGKRKVSSEIKAIPSIRVSKLIEQKKTDTNILPKTVFFMSRETVKSVRDRIPTLGNMFVTRYGILPRDIIFLSVLVTKHAYVRGPRYHIIPLYKGENGTIRAIQIHYGFMEKLDVENDIRKIVHEENLGISPDPHNWTIEMLQEKVWIGPSFKGWRKLRYLLFKMLLKNADNADHYFHVGRKINLSYEVLPVHVH